MIAVAETSPPAATRTRAAGGMCRGIGTLKPLSPDVCQDALGDAVKWLKSICFRHVERHSGGSLSWVTRSEARLT